MTDDQLLKLLRAADPLPANRAAALPLGAAEDELLDLLLAQAHPVAAPPGNPAPTRGRRRRVLPRLALAVAAVSVAMMAFLSLGSGPGDRSGTVWAAQQVRFAEASPLVLLQAPGWRVEYADEQSAQEGELHFRTGPTPPRQTTPQFAGDTGPVPADLTVAQLNWRGGTLENWIKDRGHDAEVSATAPVLGTTAHVYQYSGGTPGHRDVTALFRYDGRVLEFRAGAADVTAFKALLATLTRVDTDTWLSAMPPSVVKTTDRDTAIQGMLRGIPVPPGFDTGQIKGADLTKDRYQLGAAVTGLVSCRWLQRWAKARRSGDSAAVDQAVAAMATAKDWPILREMQKEGDYPRVLWEYADAMRSGQVKGGSFEEGASSALGCSGVQIGPGPPGPSKP
ncbi:MAG: hypothetical protein JWO02_4714 [Solirubrobacterales bacterium]|nr:hypothetical protein [Solirubrobacterales bacterium]